MSFISNYEYYILRYAGKPPAPKGEKLNMENIIQRHAAVAHINTGVACVVEFVEANRLKGTGGKLRKLVNWARLTKDVATTGIVGQYESRDTWERQRNTIDKEIIMMYDPDNTMKHPIPIHYWLLCSLNGKRIV